MLVRSDYVGLGFLPTCMISHVICPCRLNNGCISGKSLLTSRLKKTTLGLFVSKKHQRRFICATCTLESGNRNPNFGLKFGNSSKGNVEAQNLYVVKHISNELDYDKQCQVESEFTNYQEDPMVDKLRTQLGEIHPIPSPSINKNVAGLFVLFFFFGIVFDKLWTSRKSNKAEADVRAGIWPQVPTSFSLFLEKDLQRKESVEWVNMVVGKLWKVYKEGLENWVIGLLQPVIDDLKKPDYVERVEIKQFSLGEEPLSVRNVERRTSRGANDLQYQIGLRYTGDARMLLALKLKFGIIPIVLPVVIRDFDIDGELWVKLRLITTEPWVGAVSWAFVSLPKIKFELFPFRLFNLMAIPVLSMFLLKLFTEDLPRLFVRPKKIVLDFQKGKSLGPVSNDFNNNSTIQEGDNKDFFGELSVTLVDARKVPYAFFAKTDPYVILRLGDQEIRSKKNSLTTVIGSPGEPIWNQDFHMLVINPRKQRLNVQVRDSIGFTNITIGTGEVDLGSLQDTVPTDTIVALRGGLFGRSSCGEILLRLTYKAYVEDEDDETAKVEFMNNDMSDDELLDSDVVNGSYGKSESDWPIKRETDAFMDVLTALLVSEEFQGIVASETGNAKAFKDPVKPEPTVSQAHDRNANSSLPDSERTSRGLGDSTLLWLAVITGIAVLVSINIGDSGFLNP